MPLPLPDLPPPRLRLQDGLWFLDLHSGLGVPAALEALVVAWDWLRVRQVPVRLTVLHGYGSKGPGGEIYLALHQTFAHNRRLLGVRHPVEHGRVNPGVTVVTSRADGPLEIPASLPRLHP